MPVHEHRMLSEGMEVSFCLVVTSDTIFKGEKEDQVTPLVENLVKSQGHHLINKVLVPNDVGKITSSVNSMIDKCDVILVTGGTGLSMRDVSVDAIKKMCDKDIPGFGEIFRYLTYLQYGPASMASRAHACVIKNSLVFVTPGSTDAVGMALRRLILPEIRHLVFEVKK